jgi:hypothetical protein
MEPSGVEATAVMADGLSQSRSKSSAGVCGFGGGGGG